MEHLEKPLKYFTKDTPKYYHPINAGVGLNEKANSKFNGLSDSSYVIFSTVIMEIENRLVIDYASGVSSSIVVAQGRTLIWSISSNTFFSPQKVCLYVWQKTELFMSYFYCGTNTIDIRYQNKCKIELPCMHISPKEILENVFHKLCMKHFRQIKINKTVGENCKYFFYGDSWYWGPTTPSFWLAEFGEITASP